MNCLVLVASTWRAQRKLAQVLTTTVPQPTICFTKDNAIARRVLAKAEAIASRVSADDRCARSLKELLALPVLAVSTKQDESLCVP